MVGLGLQLVPKTQIIGTPVSDLRHSEPFNAGLISTIEIFCRRWRWSTADSYAPVT
jgi:hypothetical protein